MMMTRILVVVLIIAIASFTKGDPAECMAFQGKITIESINDQSDQIVCNNPVERKYRLAVTSQKGDFDEAAAMCRGKGGTLVAETLKNEIYREAFENILTYYSQENSLWIGILDKGHEGDWRFLNGPLVSAREGNSPNVIYSWLPGQPNNYNGYEHCGVLWVAMRSGNLLINDTQCSVSGFFYGICEIEI